MLESGVPGRVCRQGSAEPGVQYTRLSANLIKGDRIEHERIDVSMQKAVIRLSGGLDSPIALAVAEGFAKAGIKDPLLAELGASGVAAESAL